MRSPAEALEIQPPTLPRGNYAPISVKPEGGGGGGGGVGHRVGILTFSKKNCQNPQQLCKCPVTAEPALCFGYFRRTEAKARRARSASRMRAEERISTGKL